MAIFQLKMYCVKLQVKIKGNEILKFKMKIYFNGIQDLDIGLKGNISINPRFIISNLDDVKW